MKHDFCPYCMTPVEEGKPCGACGLTQGSYTPSPHHLPPGTVLKERYLVGRVLGEGGFGITYIGCDLQLELKVAIKEYFPTDKASRVSQASLDVASYTGAAGVNYDKGLEKFLQEARTIARMDKQPVIVNVRDFFQVNHTAYIVMEYVEGTTFKELAEQRGGRIPAGELLYLMEPLFFALKEMHANGLIHRDISPENLMIEKGEVRLLDFGCARESADGGNTLTIALKHGYAPVEQYQSKGQGPWTDVYALSATIYYCLTGRKPPQAMDRLVEDELIPPRKLGVDLTQRQENALLHGMAVPPKRRFQTMDEFHTALYEGFVPGTADKDSGDTPAVTATVNETGDGADKTVEATADGGRPPFDLPTWLRQNRLLAGGAAAALALVILLAAVLPRLLGPSAADDPGPTATQEAETQPGAEDTPEPSQTQAPDPNVDYLAQVMETVAWLQQNDAELEPDALRAKLDELPIDELFADAVHVTTLAELDAALDKRENGRPIVIDGDIDFSDAPQDQNRNNRVPVLISEGVTVSGAWLDSDGGLSQFENPVSVGSTWTVDGSILVNRGTLRGQVILGDWDNDSEAETSALLNYGAYYGPLGAGYEEADASYVVVNQGTFAHLMGQLRRTSLYNLGTILHGGIAPEGEELVRTVPTQSYYMDLIGCYFYNSGEIVLEGLDDSRRGEITLADRAVMANHGSIRIGSYGNLSNRATLHNYGEITGTSGTAGLDNLGWLWNTGTDYVMDVSCSNVGIVQYSPDRPVSGIQAGGGGAALPFNWYKGMEEQDGYYYAGTVEEFHEALENRDCAWIILHGDVTLTEDVILTKGLAIPYDASLTVDGASLTVAGENGRLYGDAPIDLRGGVLTVRDEAVAVVHTLTDCGGITLKNEGYLIVTGPFKPNDNAVIQLTDANYLNCIGALDLTGARVDIAEGILRPCGGVNLYGCMVDIHAGGFLPTSCELFFDPDTVITIAEGGSLDITGWDNMDMACQLTNYGRLGLDHSQVISGSVVNHGDIHVWGGPNALLRVSGSLENHGTVEFEWGGRFQPWAAGTVTGVPEQYVTE